MKGNSFFWGCLLLVCLNLFLPLLTQAKTAISLPNPPYAELAILNLTPLECYCDPEAPIQTLTEVVLAAVRCHPRITEVRALARGALARIDQARGEYFPKLDVRLAAGRQQFKDPFTLQPNEELGTLTPTARTLSRTETKAVLTQPVFSGFSTYNLVRQRTAEAIAARFNVCDQNENIAFNTAKAYVDVMRTEKILLLAENFVLIHADILHKARVLYKGGASRKADLDLAISRYNQAQATREAAAGLYQNAIAIFVNFAGVHPCHLTCPCVPRQRLPPCMEKAYEVALNLNPALIRAKERYRAAKAAVEVAKAPFYPKVNIELSTENDNNLDGVPGRVIDNRAMVILNYNLLNGGIDLANLNATIEEANAARAQIQQICRDVIRNITQSWSAWVTAAARIPELIANVRAGKQVVYGYRKQYFLIGDRSLLDVLNVENELFRAQSELINATYDEITYTYQIFASIGILVPTLSSCCPCS